MVVERDGDPAADSSKGSDQSRGIFRISGKLAKVKNVPTNAGLEVANDARHDFVNVRFLDTYVARGDSVIAADDADGAQRQRSPAERFVE